MEETVYEIQLPEHWTWVELKDLTENPKNDIVDGPFGSNLKSDEYTETGIPVFKIQNIKENRFVNKNINFVNPTKAEELSRHSFQKGDLIITKLGNPLGLCCKVPEKYPYGIIVADLMRFRPSARRVVIQYLMYGINSVIVQNQFKAITKGTTRPRVNLTIVRGIKFPLPPLPEQRAIVSKIEQLFSELDNGIANLKLAQEQLKVYRQAVLKKAFEGELTKKWREQQTDFVPVSVTIKHLQSAKQHTKDRANYKVKKIDETNLPDLPPKWEWHSIIEVCNRVTVGHVGPMKDEYLEDGVPFLRSQNVRENRYDPLGLKFISPEFHNKIRKSALEPNDLVIVRSGVNVGMSCIIPDHLKEANCSDLVVIKQPFGFVSKYGSYYLNSIAKSTIDSNKVGVAIPHFNTQSVASFLIPLPSLPEQQAIVQETETRLSVCDKIEQDIETNLGKAEALRQSILKKAFEGKLLNERELAEVRKAEDWEPAEVLLEKIKVEKTRK